ncbi:hypothetical protein SDC9_133048 [bioreactor metagenome]|uniref:Uncharacterized protein n=1 Tax=bioreactor metagenome TaxID=1076179 RepID=A0A645D9S6_9ZZZZ
MLKPVKDAYAAIAAAAAAAMKVELKINSPSKVTEDVGMNTGMGAIIGVEGQIERFRQTMRDLAKAGVDGYQTGNILDVLGPGAYEQNGKIYVSAQQSTLTARSSSPAGGTINIEVSPVYHITGNNKPEAVRSVLQQHSGELRDLVLDIVADAEFDSRRRGYDV